MRGTRRPSTTDRVDVGDALQRLRRVAGDDLGDAGERVLLVAGIDALGRVADEEVLLPLHARVALEHRNADLLGRARVDGRLVDDGGAALQCAADELARADQRREVGLVRVVDRRGDGDDDEVRLGRARRDPSSLRAASRRRAPRGSPRRSGPRRDGTRRPWPARDRSRPYGTCGRTRPRAGARRSQGRRRQRPGRGWKGRPRDRRGSC